MSRKQPSHPGQDRRKFLKGAVIVSSATALSSVSAGLISEHRSEKKQKDAASRESKGYHETPHIQAYYNSLRD